MSPRTVGRSKRRSWLWPLVMSGALLFFALAILFGATQAYFSSARLKAELAKVLAPKADELQVSVQDLQLTLSGFLPRLAIEATDVQILVLKDCRLPPIHFDRALVQLSWRSLFDGKARMGPISIGELTANFDLSGCEKTSDAQIPAEPKRTVANEGAQSAKGEGKEALKNLAAKEPAKFSVSQGEPIFSSLNIENVNLQWNGQKVRFSHLKTSSYIPGKSLKLRSSMDWLLPGLLDYEQPRFLVELAWDETKVEAELKGKWKEGVIEIDGDWHRDLGGRPVYQAKVKLQNVPLSPISGALSKYGLWKSPLQYKSVWLSCEMQITGDETVRAGGIVTNGCALSGELGKARIPHLKLGFSQKDLRHFEIQQPFEIELASIDVEKVLTVFQIDMLKGILREFGQLNGAVTVDVDGKSEFIGEISNLIIGFSRNRARGQQWVSKLAGRFSVFGQRVSGQLDELVLKDGDFKGTMSFNFDRHFTEGHVQVGVQRIQFSPGIQALFFGGETSPLSIFGKLGVESNKVSKWEGELGFDRLQRQDVLLESVRVKSNFVDQKLVLLPQVQSGWVSVESAFYRWAKPVFLGEKFEDQKVDFKEIKGKLEIGKSSGSWSRAQVRIEPEKIILSSEGRWNEKNGLSGWMNVDFPEFKMVKWDIGGLTQEPKLSPNAVNMRELAKQRNQKKKK